jgi:hypothetical protein
MLLVTMFPKEPRQAGLQWVSLDFICEWKGSSALIGCLGSIWPPKVLVLLSSTFTKEYRHAWLQWLSLDFPCKSKTYLGSLDCMTVNRINPIDSKHPKESSDACLQWFSLDFPSLTCTCLDSLVFILVARLPKEPRQVFLQWLLLDYPLTARVTVLKCLLGLFICCHVSKGAKAKAVNVAFNWISCVYLRKLIMNSSASMLFKQLG